MTLLDHRPDDAADAAPLLTLEAAELRAATARFRLPRGAAGPGVDSDPQAAAAGPGPRPRRRRIAGAAQAAVAAAGMVVALAVVAAAAGYLTLPHGAVSGRLTGQSADWLIPAFALAAIIAAVTAWQAARRLLEGRKAANVLTVVAATVATAVSATGMWQFFTVYVPTLDVWIRIPIFAFLELATLAEALRARDNMRDFASSGIDGLAMWVLTGTSAFLASLASTTLAEALFRLAPPLVAAWLWERTLVNERRRRRDRRKREISWRISLERMLVRLGLAEPTGKTIGEVAAQRRITTLAMAANRVTILEAGSASAWRQRRADRQLRVALTAAVEHADLAVDPLRQQQLVDQIAVLGSHRELVTLTPGTPWAKLAAGGQHDARVPHSEPPPDYEQPDDDQDERADNGSYTQLADELSKALRTPAGRGPARLHELLAGRGDYPGLVSALGRQARDGKVGAKRLMAFTALYATGRLDSPAAIATWIAAIVPGQPGRVDKADIRRARDRIAPHWRAINYSPAVASGEQHDIPQESA
jgi:hypothetical protein